MTSHKVVNDYTDDDASSNSNIKVFVRARPTDDDLAKKETDLAAHSSFIEVDSHDKRKITIRDPDSSNQRYGEVNFQFDKVFWTDTTQSEIFNEICTTHIDQVLQGYNSCCLAYGQTGSGKTYTMFGNDGDVRGVIPRSMEYLFNVLKGRNSSNDIAIVCSFLEIYNDQIRDLGKAYSVALGSSSDDSEALYQKTSDIFKNLQDKRGNNHFAPAFHRPGSAVQKVALDTPGVKEVADQYNTMNYEIREDNEGNVFVKDLSLVPVSTVEEVMAMINIGMRVRATHETKMNATSSRSHTVFTVTVLQRDKITGDSVTGMFNLIDLAGSERLKKSESTGSRLKEALHINSSLSALGKVVMSLGSSTEATHVPYRDSKLTRILQNSLGGNSFTSIIAALQPHPDFYDECLSTLQFANRCRNVKNNPKVNKLDATEDKDTKIKKLTDEVGTLRQKLQATRGSGFGPAGGITSKGGKMEPNALLVLLKKLGINASLDNNGDLIVDGKKVSLSDLDGGGSTSDGSTDTSNRHGGGDKSRGNGVGTAQADKLNKMIKDLKDSNATYMTKAKERKTEMEEQGREMQRLSSELTKATLTIKHKEFEYNQLLQEKERALKELTGVKEYQMQNEIQAIVEKNNNMLAEQQNYLNQVPESLKEYTEIVKKTSTEAKAFDKPIRIEFEKHLKHLEQGRLTELSNIKNQYEHFLLEKDKALSGFVEAFNKYRTKKSEQLRMAESEIVRLYDYTSKIEQILEDAENGKYQLQQTQGSKGGKSTTGIASQFMSSGGQEGGALVLPKGLKPANPLKVTGGKQLLLTMKIVEKHKERVEKLDAMKEEAFRKSLHYAAKTTATASGGMDETLEAQVRELLVSKGNVVSKSSKAKAKAMKKKGPIETETKNTDEEDNNRPSTTSDIKKVNTEFIRVEGSKRAQTVGGNGVAFTDDLWQELLHLREKEKEEDANVDKVLRQLESNQTLVYIQNLEKEVAELRSALRKSTNNVTNVRVVNDSLSRSQRITHGNI